MTIAQSRRSTHVARELGRSAERHSLRQNAIWMFGGQAITWVLTAATLALLPRYLGPQQMGSLGIGLTFSALAGVVAGVGMATLITREIARDREAGCQLLATALWLHIGLGLLGTLVCVAVGFALGYGRATQLAIAVNAATIPLNLLIVLGFGALQGAEVMRHQAIWDALNKLATLVALLVIVVLDLGFTVFLAVSFLSAAFVAVPGVVLMHRYLPFRIGSFEPGIARRLLVQSLPFCTFGIVLAVYPAVDIVLLSVLSGEEAVGIYATPVRIFGTLLFGPTIIMTVVFPRLAASFVDSSEHLRRIARQTLDVVIGLTVPVALLTAGAGPTFLPKLLGKDFSDSAPVLLLLALVLISTTVNMVAHRVLIAVDRQKRWTLVMCVALVAKVLLDLLFIAIADSWFGNAALGAAAAFLAVETAMAAAAFVMMPRGVVDHATAGRYARLAVAVLAASGVMFLARPAGFVGIGAAGAASYALAAMLLRVYTPGQLVDGGRWILGRKSASDVAALHLRAVTEAVRTPRPVRFVPARATFLHAPERMKGVRTTTGE